MPDAKAEIAGYSIATRFGKGEKMIHDRGWARPATRSETLEQIESIYRANRWGKIEQDANHRLCGLAVKPLTDYVDDELKRILNDMENFRMVIYQD